MICVCVCVCVRYVFMCNILFIYPHYLSFIVVLNIAINKEHIKINLFGFNSYTDINTLCDLVLICLFVYNCLFVFVRLFYVLLCAVYILDFVSSRISEILLGKDLNQTWNIKMHPKVAHCGGCAILT